jgi:alanyl-tRNA synthetase
MNWTTNQIRKTFLQYFEEKQHEIVTSAPIVIKDDPTLMFTNAGMNQFKGVFLGNESRSISRAADSQKCLRVSGKHNDLEEVGRDHYHHTMFEMLGNWSFGDYFKQQAIDWAWELLTEVYGLDKDRIYVSVFEGDESLKLELDTEARNIWSKHVEDDRILPFGRKDNFWEMGETGPCGPCSEIHYDLRTAEERAKVGGAALVNQDHPEVIEIWNLVFIQFNNHEDGTLSNLKAKHVDTGMGLERLARALQNVDSNYKVDLFHALITEIEKLTSKKYKGSAELSDIAFRVIADHVRAVSFCIADGQLPSNTGAGYVIRRVLRRAIRYGFSQLDLTQPFIYKVAQKLIDSMGDAYPELVRNQTLITKVIQEEEKSFLQTLDKGLDRISNYIKQNATQIDGIFAFELYDTFGFPIDLTKLIAEEQNFTVDLVGFEAELKKQKDRSRQASKAEFGDWSVLDEGENSEFVGYDQLTEVTRVMKYRRAKVKGKETFQVILEKTPFYAESGGQIGDRGFLDFGDESIDVIDTKKENNEFIHFVSSLPENVEGEVQANVDGALRQEIMKNHSATHLLHYALRDLLGNHVEQKGSMVAADKLRFDFSHFEKITDDQVEKIEWEVRQLIREQMALEDFRSMPISKAKEMGAMALFGEKYGNDVRVVKFGDSIELCGGTHVENTASIGGFKIISEGSVASGIRRIEALTGIAYQEYVSTRLGLVSKLEGLLGNPKDVFTSVEKLIAENRDFSKELDGFKVLQQNQIRDGIITSSKSHSDYQFIVKEFEGVEGKIVKDALFAATSSSDNLIAIALGHSDDKPYIIVAISKALAITKDLDAGAIVRSLAKHINGGGGGQRFLAMAGGKTKQGLREALVHANEIIKV